MLEKIKQRIADTEDRQKAFKLLMYADAPMLILRILGGSEAVSGDVWVKGGKRIVGVFTTPTGDTGLLGLYELLELREARFEVMEAIIDPQGDVIDVSIEELVEDEQKVMTWIADKTGIERKSTTDNDSKKNGAKADKTETAEVELIAQTKVDEVASAASDSTKAKESEPVVAEASAKETSAKAEAESNSDTDAVPKSEDKTEDKPKSKDKSGKKKGSKSDSGVREAIKAESDTTSRSAEPETSIESKVETVAEEKAEPAGDTAEQPGDEQLGDEAAQPADEAAQPADKAKSDSDGSIPFAMAPEIEQRLQDVLNIKDVEEESISHDIEIAMAPEMEERLQKVLNFKPHELLGLDAGNLKEVLGMGVNSGTITSESISVSSEATEAYLAGSNEPSLLADDTRLDHKKRADMEALAMLTGEDPAGFYEKAQNLDVVVDDLADQRSAEVNAIGAIMRDTGDAFYDKAEIPAEDDSVLQEKRRLEYQALNDFLGEKKESFYEKPAELTDEPAEGLGDLQKRVLSIMETESSDPATFESKDPTMLLNDGSLMPKWTVEESAKVEVPPDEPEAPEEEDYAIPQIPPSPYADKTAALTNQDKLGNQLALGPSEDDMSLLLRGKDEDHKIVAANIARMKSEPIPRRTIIAACIAALAIPMFAFGMMRYQNGVAQADDEDRRSASTLVKSSVEKESLANKPSEGYRAAAGAPSGSGSGKPYYSDNYSEGSAASDGSGPVDQNLKYVPSKTPLPQPDGNQVVQDERVISQCNNLVSHGQAAQAVQIYNSALVRSPGNIQLRIAAVRALVAMKDYRRAKILCMAGMHDAANAGDFANLYNLLKSLP